MNIEGIQITLNIGIQKGSVEDANHWDFIRKEVDFINRKGQKRMDFTTSNQTYKCGGSPRIRQRHLTGGIPKQTFDPKRFLGFSLIQPTMTNRP